MVDVRSKFCDHPGGCTVHHSFGLPGGSASRCGTHKEPGMINVHAKRCGHPGGCAVHPYFGFPGNPASRCSTHKDTGMIDVRSRHCDHPGGCNKAPTFGPPGSKAARCSTHKEPGMINVRSKLCDYPGGCNTQAGYGSPGGSVARCFTHMEPGMVNKKHPSRSSRSIPSHSPDRLPPPEQAPAIPAAAVAGSRHDGGTHGDSLSNGEAVVGYCPRGSVGGGPSVADADKSSGGSAPPLESGSPPVMSRQNTALQHQLAPRPAPLPLSAAAPSSAENVPSSAAAARGGSRRLRQEAPAAVEDQQQDTLNNDRLSSKKPRGAEPAHHAQAAHPPLLGAAPAQVTPVITAAVVALASPLQHSTATALTAVSHRLSSGETAPGLLASQPQVVTAASPLAAPFTVALAASPQAGPAMAATSPFLGTGSSGLRGAGSAVKEEPGVWQVDALPFTSVIKAEAPSGAAAVAPPPSSTLPPLPAPVPLSSVLALEALLRRAVALVAPLLPQPAPRFLVEDWLDRWEGCLRELEAHLDMRVVTEGCCFQRHMAAAVEGGEADNYESMLRMIQLLT